MSALVMARMQFGFTISFHIIFPGLTIGLASYLAVLEALHLKTKRPVYLELYQFWIKVFAIAFGMGVVSGLVMAYQFGTNWSGFSRFAGGITGPLLAYEVLTAFFLEAGFLGIMLFGRERVGPGLHFLATAMVAMGTLVSTTWIIASNSWMQTPQGFEIIDNRVVPVDWIAVIFNPSFPYRLAHMSVAAFLSTALMVAGTAAFHLLRGNDTVRVRTMLSMALWMLLVAAPLQAFLGDQHGLNTLEHQPAKLAAIEGHWERTPADEGVSELLFGLPDMEAETTRYGIAVPHLGSLILTHTWNGQIPALKDFAPEDRPNSTIVFWTFRVMIGLGFAMIGLAFTGNALRFRDRLFTNRWFLRAALLMGPAGLVAMLAGWFTTEIGRQPWVVYGVMRTRDAVSVHPPEEVAFTLAVFVIVYLIVFGTGTAYALRVLAKGPDGFADEPPAGGPGQPRQPMRPLSAVSTGALAPVNEAPHGH